MENNAPPHRLGRYEIIRELGKGAMGVVYEGRDPSLGRRVAIKTARRDVIERSGLAKEMMERFLREARAAGVLNHPNIITIYDVGEEAGMAYIAMEFLEGRDLNTALDEQRRFDVETVVNYGTQICDALACAHDQGVFHRDVKPANIFIPDQGVIKVVDFGIARTHDSTLTQDGVLIGTPTYMSPEQFMGQKVDARSDLFSVGIILYEMLTGEKPFTGEALTTIMHHILKSDPAPPHELNYLVPEALSNVVMKALSKRPQERYANGRLMAKALRESIKNTPDMNVVMGASTAMESTVVATAHQPLTQAKEKVPDGKVIESTTLSQSPPPSSTAHAATVAEKAPAGFGDYSKTDASTLKGGDALTGGKSPLRLLATHSRIIVGGIAVLCILAGLTVHLLSSSPAAPTDGASETNAAPVTPQTTTAVRVSVYTTPDGSVFEEYNGLDAATDKAAWLEVDMLPKGSVAPILESGWSVQTSNPDDKTVYDTKALIDGTAVVSAPVGASRIKYDILKAEQSIDNITLDSPQWQEMQAFLLYVK